MQPCQYCGETDCNCGANDHSKPYYEDKCPNCGQEYCDCREGDDSYNAMLKERAARWAKEAKEEKIQNIVFYSILSVLAMFTIVFLVKGCGV